MKPQYCFVYFSIATVLFWVIVPEVNHPIFGLDCRSHHSALNCNSTAQCRCDERRSISLYPFSQSIPLAKQWIRVPMAGFLFSDLCPPSMHLTHWRLLRKGEGPSRRRSSGAKIAVGQRGGNLSAIVLTLTLFSARHGLRSIPKSGPAWHGGSVTDPIMSPGPVPVTEAVPI